MSELIGRYAEGASAGPGSYGITVGYKQKEAAKLTESVMLILGLGIHHGWVKYTRSEAVAAADGGKSRSGTIRYQVCRVQGRRHDCVWSLACLRSLLLSLC